MSEAVPWQQAAHRLRGAGRPLLQQHMPALDVLRGLAILWVLLNHGLVFDGSHAHAGPHLLLLAADAGWLGVNLFFVLSGFLITGILLDSQQEERYYKRFYTRRALRILPAYLLLVAVLCSFHRLSGGALAVALTFTTNDAFLFGVRQPYGLLWSIAVEEQFYLIWPLVVRRHSPRALAWFCAAVLVVDPMLRFGSAAGYLPPADVQRNALLIADNLACGALAALFVRSRWGTAGPGLRAGVAVMGLALGLEAAGLPFGILHRGTAFGAALQHSPWNLFFTGLTLVALSLPPAPFASAVAAPLRFFGYISYGLYLCHLLVFGAYDRVVAALPGAAHAALETAYLRLLLAGALATLVAWLSRRFLEAPFLRLGRAAAAGPAALDGDADRRVALPGEPGR